MAKKKNETIMDTMKRVAKQQTHEAYINDLREGRRLNRAQTFASGKEYRRKGKYPDAYG